jgi:predicted nucleotidyltransferase
MSEQVQQPQPQEQVVELDLSSVPWLKGRMSFLALAGSRAYGTQVPESDLDWRGVAIPPVEVCHDLWTRFDTFTPPKGENQPDLEIHSLQKFMNLAGKGTMGILELLFLPEDCYILKGYGLDILIKNRNEFLSQRIGHRIGGNVEQFKRLLVKKWDPKTAMHIVRLLKTGTEILQGEPWKVRRHHEELMPIRLGMRTEISVLEEILDLEAKFTLAQLTSKLPTEPNPKALTRVYREILEGSWAYEVLMPVMDGSWTRQKHVFAGVQIHSRTISEIR